MDLREFMDLGLLQEINRQLLHPLGYAMSFHVDDDDPSRVTFDGIIDDRADPRGGWFDFTSWPTREEALSRFKSNTATVERAWEDRKTARVAALGYMVQPATNDALCPPEDDEAQD